MVGRPAAISDSERFFEKVARDNKTGCWLWQAAISSGGYATFSANGRQVRAHKYAYEQFKGPVPNGLVLDHLCCIKHCVNPEHLEPVTQRENISRGLSFIPKQARATHCIHGHEYSEANTIRDKKGRRRCRTCWLNNTAKWKKEHPEAQREYLRKWRLKHGRPRRAPAMTPEKEQQ